MTMERCLIGVGANLDPEENIAEGLGLLARLVPVTAVSPFYATAAIGRPGQPDYLNGVVLVEHGCGPAALRDDILRPVEAARGRVRTADAYAARTLDLDVLLYGERASREAGMVLPDPHLWERPFLAAAALELAPGLVVPGTGRLLRDLADRVAVAACRRADAFSERIREIIER
jgi:2-amino-4-hydroxy-6-hydroxymethyldihydropteridine diphosphokinase